MNSSVPDDRRAFGWAVPVSVAVHALIAWVLIFGLPTSLLQPPKEDVVSVELVPPPEPEKPEPEPPQEKPKPEPPQEKPKPEPPQEQPKPEPPQEQPKPEPPQEQPKPEPPQEKPKPEPPQKKPEPEPPREKAETPPQEEPKPDKAAQEKKPDPPPVSALRPVFRFGEKDAGPRKSPDGNSAGETSPPPAPAAEAPPEKEHQQPDAPVPLTAAGSKDQAPQPGPPASPSPGAPASEPAATKPAQTAKVQKAPELREAKRLYSQTAIGDPTATTAMGNIPRGVRAGQLCVTELREQLLHASPPYFPDLLPSQPLREGTVIEIPNAAFRTNGQWINLGFRCEVDQDATKVESFAFRVGAPIPRGDWQRRGLPAQ